MILLLAIATVLLFAAGLATGPVTVSPSRIAAIVAAVVERGSVADGDYESNILINIRLPRVLLALEVGAALAASGALMQGLFRNPLADPGLIGVSSGAGLAAATTIVLGGGLSASMVGGGFAFPTLSFGAFLGGLISTSVIYAISTRGGRTSMATMLLAGVGLGAFCGALTGLLAFWSNDQQLRDLTFWTLGSLNGATWSKTMTIAPVILLLVASAPFLGPSLNALALGEAEAFHVGVRVQLIKMVCIALAALAVGASVASSGVIGFVGLVAPHIVRLSVGPDNRLLLPLATLLGGALLIGADAIARKLVAPAELPLGVVTSAIGAPFFLWLLLTRSRGVM
jgi:iron complex transport system permease protein